MGITARKNPTKAQREWMKEAGYTSAQMDAFWAENIDSHPLIRTLQQQGLTWRDLNMSCLQQLPTLKENFLKHEAEKRAKEKAEAEAKAREEAEKEYYFDHFEEIMLKKIDAGENLTKDELYELICNYDVDTEYGDNRRWTRTVTTIIELFGRFFAIDWEEGLTECQENEFYNQPVEVRKHTYEKTVTVTEWIEVSR